MLDGSKGGAHRCPIQTPSKQTTFHICSAKNTKLSLTETVCLHQTWNAHAVGLLQSDGLWPMHSHEGAWSTHFQPQIGCRHCRWSQQSRQSRCDQHERPHKHETPEQVEQDLCCPFKVDTLDLDANGLDACMLSSMNGLWPAWFDPLCWSGSSQCPEIWAAPGTWT